MSSAEYATRYIRRGMAPVPIPRGQKGPRISNWQHLRLTLEDVPRYFTNGQNIGLLLGKPSGGLVDVDLDTPEAVSVGRYLLPPTLRSGRERSPNSHYWYRCDPVPETAKFQVPRTGEGSEMLVELRSTGKQTVVAPSVHPAGDRYTWGEGEISEIPGSQLLQYAREVATAALLVRHWPTRGRHELALAAAGYLGRRLAPERVEAIIEAAAAAAGDEEWRDRVRAVRDTLDNLAAGGAVTGGNTLEQLAPGVPEILSRWWGWGRGDPPSRPTTGTEPRRFNLTDMGNAERFVARHGRDVRYCYLWGKWLVWSGVRWERDDSGRVHRLAKETVRGIYAEAAAAADEGTRKAIAQHATRSEAEAKIKAMLELAKSEVPVSPNDLDANPWLLNASNGTVDLKAGELRPHRREDLLTKMAGAKYDPAAATPAWEAFLERVLPGEELRGFVQRGAGYSATGDTSEQVMFINHGAGANGKSTFQEALAMALGEYAMRAPTEMLMMKRSGGVPNDVARLKGARFVAASETEEGRRLAESLVKDLTGQDTISARFMRAEFFDFKPSHKLWISTNHKPEIRGTDNAIWRRIRLVPWSVVVPPAERDRKLPEKLRAEAAGILSWIVRGCLDWCRAGLGEPEEVRDATAEYRAEQDVLAGFLEDCCVLRPEAWVKFADLYEAYTGWCEKSKEFVQNKRRFGNQLKERGFEPARGTGNAPIRTGLALCSDREPPGGGGHDRRPQGNSVQGGTGQNSYPTALRQGGEPSPGGSENRAQGNSCSESYPTVTPQSTSKSQLSDATVTERYPKNTMNSSNFGPREVTATQGNYSNYGNHDAYDRLVEERIREFEERDGVL